MTYNLIIWTSTRGKRRIGRQHFTFIEALQLKSGFENIDIRISVMMDHGELKKL